MEPIASLDAIGRQASAAAAQWVGAEMGAPKPANPYDEHLQPEHHKTWQQRFEIALVRLTAKDSA